MGIDDRKVIFVDAGERLIHVHRDNLAANLQDGWSRPTILVAAEGHTPVFCHEVLLLGPAKVVERPPGVHMVVHPLTKLVALDEHGEEIELPPWAMPRIDGAPPGADSPDDGS